MGVWHLPRVRRPHSTWHADTTAQDRPHSGTGKVGAGVREARTELAKLHVEVQEDGGTKPS